MSRIWLLLYNTGEFVITKLLTVPRRSMVWDKGWGRSRWIRRVRVLVVGQRLFSGFRLLGRRWRSIIFRLSFRSLAGSWRLGRQQCVEFGVLFWVVVAWKWTTNIDNVIKLYHISFWFKQWQTELMNNKIFGTRVSMLQVKWSIFGTKSEKSLAYFLFRSSGHRPKCIKDMDTSVERGLSSGKVQFHLITLTRKYAVNIS